MLSEIGRLAGTTQGPNNRGTDFVKSVVLLNVPTTKHVIIATEGKAGGGGVRKDLFHKHGGVFHGRKQKTMRTDRHYIKHAVQVGNRVHNASVATPRQLPDLAQNVVESYMYLYAVESWTREGPQTRAV